MPFRPHVFPSAPKADLRVVRVFPVSHLHEREVLAARGLAEILDLTHYDSVAASCHFLFAVERELLVHWAPETVTPAAMEILRRTPPQRCWIIDARAINHPAVKRRRLGGPGRFELFSPT